MDASSSQAPPAGPSVAGRVIDLLEAFAAPRPTMTLSELSRHSGLPLTTTHRLVHELIGRGILSRDAAGLLHIGLRLWEIGSLSPSSVGLRESALPFLEDLYEVTHENVQLAVLDGVEAVYVERISGRRSVHALTRVGGRLPVHATGVGLVLLAHAEREVQQQVLAGPLAAYTPFTVTDPKRVRAILADIRRKGHVVSDRQIERISVSVAAPIFGRERTVVAAVSVVGSARHTDPLRLAPAVMATGRAISRRLQAG